MATNDANGSDNDPGHESFKCAMQQHFEDFKEWTQATKALQGSMQVVIEHTRPLQHIPQILHDGVMEVRLLRESLVAPATAMPKWSMPLAAVLPVIAGMAFCIVILGSVLVLGVAGAGTTRITPHGIEITKPVNP